MRIFSAPQIIKRNPWIAYLFGILLILAILKTCINQALTEPEEQNNMTPDLIYCADGNSRYAQIAIDNGWYYGAQMPNTIYHPIHFADQNWKKPNRQKYMTSLQQHQPKFATVIDWETPEELQTVLDWAEQAAQWVPHVIIIPKVIGEITKLPREIGNAQIILGYSVPTRFGGTPVPLWEFFGWPIHLLGGSPQKQIEIYHYLKPHSEIVSIDNNQTNMMASRYNQFWTPGTATYAQNRWWPTLKEANNGKMWGDGTKTADAPYEAFRRSVINLKNHWQKITGETK